MKKTLKLIACLSGWLALITAAHAQNICVDTTTYSDPSCVTMGSLNTLGVLSYTNLTVCVGQTITPPTATDTTFYNGSSQQYISHSCPDFYYLNGYVTSDEDYYAGAIYFDPAIPSSLGTAQTFVTTAKVDGIDAEGICGDLVGIELGTVTITCYGPPVITLQPVSQTVSVGIDVAFTTAATGRSPLSFQWFYNATNLIAGATSQTLLLTNVQLSQAGTYDVVVSNACGTATSSNAVLAVIVPTCVTSPSGLIAWWKAETNGLDSVSTNIGTLQNVGFSNGIVGKAFSIDPENYSSGTFVGVQINDGPQFALTNAFSIEGWVRSRGAGYVIFWRGDNRTGLDPYVLSMDGSSNLSFGISDASGNTASVQSPLAPNQWWFITATFTNGLMSLYKNGVLAAQTNTTVRPFANLISGDHPGIGIGNVNDGVNNFPFRGDIDELSFYNRALTTNEIQAIYNAGTAGKCVLSVPPVIVVQPVDGQIVLAGNNARLTVLATGTLPLHYQWYFNSSSIADATNSALTLAHVQTNNSGTYYVVVTNIAGTATSSNATLRVGYAPLITQNPFNRTNLAGTTATFSVVATGSTPLSYQWRKGGSNLANGGNVAGATASALTLSSVQDSDVASYTVYITNLFGAVTSSLPARLVVMHLPQITTQPSPASQTVVQGTNATISVIATGSTPLSYQWRFNGTSIVGATASSLTVSDVQPIDAGSYSVVITNSVGTITSSNAVVNVIVPPFIVTQPTNQLVLQNASATFSVSATGTAPLRYQWYFDGTDAIAGATDASLTIDGCIPSDEGSYTVVVTNAAGKVTSSVATLTLNEAPSVTNPQSTNVIEGTSVTFSISADGTAPLSYQWRRNGSNLAGATSDTFSIGVVQVSDQASYSVVVANSAGSVTSAGAVLTVTVPPSIVTQPSDRVVPQGAVATFSVTAAGSATLTYQWYTNGVAIGNGSKYSGATSSALTVNNSGTNDVVVYSVRVSNGAGSTTAAGARLSVVGVNRLVVDGSNPEIRDAATIALGSSITLRAIQSSTPAGVAFPSSSPVWTASDNTLTLPSAGATTATITPTNAGQFTIWATCGTSNSFVITVNSTNDVNYDGIIDSLENPNNPPQLQLGMWTFDTLDLAGLQGQLPNTTTNVAVVGGWSILAAQIDSRSNGPTVLSYRDAEVNAAVANVNLRRGTIRFLFNPDWSSTTVGGGTGPQTEARLIEVGDKASSSGSFGFYLDSKGTNVTFCTRTNGGSLITNLTGSVKLTNDNWYEFDLTYSTTNASFYLNGSLVTNNAAGMSVYPGSTVRANGFRIGGGLDGSNKGTNLAQGSFDNLETYNYPWSGPAVDNYYKHHPQPIATNQCLLAPIALYVSIATTLTNGQVTTTTNDAGQGNFVWLNWYNSSTFPLKQALTNWAYSQQFTNANDSTDTTLSTGDWIWADTGWQSSVTSSLDWLISHQTNFGVVLWNNSTGTGNNTKYEAAEYAKIQLLSYNGSAKTITYKYLGLTSCDSYSNQPPTVSMYSPPNNTIYTIASNNTAVVPLVAAAFDPENNMGKVSFYWGTSDTTCTNLLGFGTNLDSTVSTNAATNLYSLSWNNAPHGSNSVLAIASDALLLTATSQVIHVIVNWSPVVSAGANITNVWVEGSSTFVTNLTSSAWDDALPYRQTNFAWTTQLSNGPVTLGTAGSASTTATFTTNGVYRFQIAADDGVSTNSSQCYVRIQRRPFIDITSPASNATVFASAHVPVSANAYDLDGNVTNVQFSYVLSGTTNFIGTGSLAAGTNNYVVDWTNAPTASNIVLIAVATDDDNLRKTSSIPVTIISPYPAIQIVSPIDQHFIVRTLTNIYALATPAISTSPITNVQFFVSDGIKNTSLGNVTNPVGGFYQVKWLAAKPGTNIFTASVTDNRNSNALSAPVTNYVRAVPVVTISIPTNGSRYFLTNSSTNIGITASAVADSANITNVAFYHDGILLTNVATNAASATLTVTWTGVTNGTYMLQATATDNGGALGSSTNITITLLPTNQPPSVYAGPDQTVNLSASSVQLAGLVTDDGLRSNYLAVAWTKVSGPGNATFSDTNIVRPSVTFTNVGTNVLRLVGTDGQLSATSTVQIVVMDPNLPPIVDAGTNQTFILPALDDTNMIQSVVHLSVLTNVPNIGGGIDYYAPSNCAIFSVNYSDGNAHLYLLPPDGVPLPFITVSNTSVGFAGGSVEAYIATARDTLGGFNVGEIFFGNGRAGEIMRISPAGTPIGNAGYYNNAWIAITNEYYPMASLWVDRTGVWGGDLVALARSGNIYRINSSGIVTFVAHANADEGIVTIPNDVAKYGPWAGRILTGSDYPPICAADTNGNVVEYNLNGLAAENIHVIEPNENMLAVVDWDEYGIYDGPIYGVSASQFQGVVGDIIVADELDYLNRVHWNGTSFDVYRFNNLPAVWAEVNFTPEPLLALETNFVHLYGNVQDDGRLINPTSNLWTKVSGPGPVTIGNPSQTNTYALFSEPGTYYLRLSAYDGQFTSYKDTRIDVIRNQRPVVSAGTNQIVPSLTNIQLTGTVSDDGLPYHVTNVYWTVVDPPGADTRVNFLTPSNQLSTTITVLDRGTYVMRLTADDGQATNYAEVEITLASTNLTLVPKYGWPTKTNVPNTVVATVINQNNAPLSGATVSFYVNNSFETNIVTDTDGVAEFTYTSTVAERDSITATVNSEVQKTVIKDWARGILCGGTSSQFGSGCWSMEWPTNDHHNADYYVYTATAGSVITLDYHNQDQNHNTALILHGPSSNIVAITVNGHLQYTPPTSGDYLIEMADVLPASTSAGLNYTLALACGTNNQHDVLGPQIAVLWNGTNIPNGSTMTYPVTTVGTSNSLSLVVSNSGTADLYIDSSSVNADFTLINNLSGLTLNTSGTSNVVIWFNASSNETSVGQLLIKHTVTDQYGQSYYENYVLYLNGSAFPPGVAPSVHLTTPSTNDTFFAPAVIPITAVVTPGTTNVTAVYFELVTTNGPALLGVVSNGTANTYSFTWPNVPDGTYGLTAVAVDADGRSGAAPTVQVKVEASNANLPPLALPDTEPVTAGSTNNFIDVLNNDSDPDGDQLRVSDFTNPQLAGASVSRVGNGAGLFYNPPPSKPFGTDHFSYQVSDGKGGTSWTTVEIAIYPPAKPDVWMVAPVYAPNTYTTNAGAIVPLTAYVNPYQAVVKVDFFIGESFIGTVSNGTQGYYTLSNWTAVYSACGCGINAQATDKFGQVGSAQPIYIAITNEDIINSSGDLNTTLSYEGSSSTTNSFNTTDLNQVTIIRDGIVDIYGFAVHALGSNVTWQIGVFNLDGTPVKNLTPPPYDSIGGCTRPVGSGAGEGVLVKNADLTTIPNGVYYLILSATSGQIHNESKARIQLESNLKIGQFSFSQQDVVLPIKGIPFTVTRTYNSLNSNLGDFGYGWTMALMGMDIVLDETRDDAYGYPDDDSSGRAQVFSERTGGYRDVTLTLPTGKRITFYYSPDSDLLGDQRPAWVTAPGAPPGVELHVQGSPFYDAIWGYGWSGSGGMEDDLYVPYAAGDFPGFILSMPNGTTYRIDREDLGTYQTEEGFVLHAYGKPYLAEIDDRAGNRISIDKSGITYTSADNGTKRIGFERNADGLISSVSDPTAVNSGGPPAVMYNYDGNNNLVSVLRLVDRNLGTYVTNSFTYTNLSHPHFITGMIAGDGTEVAKSFYDDSGKMIAVEDADGNVTHFIHNLENNTELIVDRLGHTNIYVHDLNGNITAETNALGQVVTMAYDENNNKTNQITYVNGVPYATNAFVYDTSLNVVTDITDSLGNTNHFSYDTYGHLLTRTDARGNTKTNFYDPLTGVPNGSINALGHAYSNSYIGSLIISLTKPDGSTVTNYYDSEDNIVGCASFDVSGAIISSNKFTYDDNGNRLTSTAWRRVGGSWVSATTTYVYDGLNRLVQTIASDGGTNTTVYDLNGRVKSKVDPLGRVTTYHYDNRGHLTNTIYPNLTSESSTYDVAGNRVLSTDLGGHSTTYAYDALNQLVQTIYPDHTTNTTVYDDLGRVTETVDAMNAVTAYSYDAATRLLAITNALSTSVQRVTSYTYDNNGNQTGVFDANGHAITNVFDQQLNREIEVDGADGSKSFIGYDIGGRRNAETNQDNVVTLFGYDVAGRLTSVTNGFGTPEQLITRYVYDEAGNQIQQIDGLNHTNTYDYDGVKRCIRHTLPGGQFESFAYDQAGNRVFVTNCNGIVITNQYDSLNRLTNCVSGNHYRVQYTYNSAGLRETMTDVSGVSTYRYDVRNRLVEKRVSWTNGPTVSLNYFYDARGQVTNMFSSTSNGANLAYKYDALARLTNVLANDSTIATYSYDAAGNLKTTRLANGVTNQLAYDRADRLTNVVWNLNGSPLASFSYQTMLSGTRTNSSEVLSGTSRTYAWKYDSLYRITNENINTLGNAAYAYDRVGNRTNRTSTIGQLATGSSTYNSNDQLTTDGYDSEGNTIASGSNTYQYDVLDRLTNLNSSVFFVYDGDGNRVAKKAGGTTIYYLVDDRNPTGHPQVLEEYAGVTLQSVADYGLSLIRETQIGSNPNYFIFDGHGSTRMLVNNNGTVVNSFAYDAFGTLIASNTAAQTRYLYSAQQYDSDLGLYYNRARYLNANSGRFWTRDTYSGDTEDPISLHKYLYAKCNPVNIVDPSGHDGSEVELAAVTAIGAGVDAMGAVAVAGAEVAAETGVAGAVATAEIGTAAATEGAVAAETAALAETGVETAEVAAEVVEAEEGEGFLETAKQTLRQFGKTVKELIEDAKKIAKNNPFKVVPMPGNVIPDVTRNIINAFAEAKPFELTRCSKVVAIENRELAIGNYLKNPVRGLNGSFDEYPFASSKEGGANSRVTPVPLWQNCVQGGIIAASYKIQDINEGVPFTVVPIPRIGK